MEPVGPIFPLEHLESRRLLLCYRDPAEPRDFQLPGFTAPHTPAESHIKEHSLLFRPCLKFAANFWYACSGVWLVLVHRINARCIALK